MSRSLPARGPLTDALVDFIRDHARVAGGGILVGDNSVPPAAGWQGTQPGQGKFVSSLNITTAEASPIASETLRARHTTWRCVYGMRAIGGSRSQADYTADRGREAVIEFPRVDLTLGGEDWKVQEVMFSRFAGVDKRDPTDAPTFEIADTFEVWIVREAR